MRAAVFTLAQARTPAAALATALGVPLLDLVVHRFPDGELKLTLGGAAETALLYVPLDRPGDKLLLVLMASEALRRNGARRVVLVAPYLCYMRQDVAFHPLEAISQKVMGAMLAPALDRVVTVDAHLHRTAALGVVFPGIEAENLTAWGVVAEALAQEKIDPRTVVVGPDVESGPLVADLAGRLGLDHAVGAKTRRGDRDVSIVFDAAVSLAGRPALLIDDVVSSGGTLVEVAEALGRAGVTAIDAIVTHALHDEETAARLARAGIRSLRSSTSVPHPSNAISLTAMLAGALAREIAAEATS